MTTSFHLLFSNSHFTLIYPFSFTNWKMIHGNPLKIVNCEMKNAALEGDAIC